MQRTVVILGRARLRTWIAVVQAGERTLAGVLGKGKKNCEWIYRYGANPGKPGSGIVPLFRSWPLGRRSGRVPALPYPPPRSVQRTASDGRRATHGWATLLRTRMSGFSLIRAKTRMRHCRQISQLRGIVHMLLFTSMFRKGGWNATGSR
jgi:hypothetical protein